MQNDEALGSLEGRDLLADRAYKEIHTAILANRLLPGTPLSVPELARQMNISRSPVREAVQRLVHQGLAVTVPYRGAEVARVTVADLQELYEVREMLEGLAARRATERLDPDSRRLLESIVEEHEAVLREGQGLEAHMETDMRFHQLIRELAANKHLLESLNTLQGKVSLAMHSLWRTEDAPYRALEEHKRILSAMLVGDPEAAEAESRAHVVRISSDLADSASGGGEVEQRGGYGRS